MAKWGESTPGNGHGMSRAHGKNELWVLASRMCWVSLWNTKEVSGAGTGTARVVGGKTGGVGIRGAGGQGN